MKVSTNKFELREVQKAMMYRYILEGKYRLYRWKLNSSNVIVVIQNNLLIVSFVGLVVGKNNLIEQSR